MTARRFRLVLTGDSAEAALPRLAEGVRTPPVLRRVSEFVVSEFALSGGGRVHQAELKAGFAAAPDYYALDTDPASTTSAIDPADVLDLTGWVGQDGILRWNAPPGSWRVLRFGMSLTGQTNGPAPTEATGLEVDKLDGTKVRRYLDTYLTLFDGAALDALLSDSIESGPQNATDLLRERFTELRGYDPLPWLPALAGYVVGDAERSDRFLWDHRRTIGDLVSTEYYGTLEDEAHTRGLTYYAEALEDRRPQLGDDLAMRSHADVPMGAMWMFDADGGGPAPTYLADLKGASSVAHVHGKAFTGAESMTALHRPWSYTPGGSSTSPTWSSRWGSPGSASTPHRTSRPRCHRPASASRPCSDRRSSDPSRGRTSPARGSTTWPAARGCSTRARLLWTSRCSSARRGRSRVCSVRRRIAPCRPASTSTTWTSPASRRGSPSPRGTWRRERSATGCSTSADPAPG